MDVSRSPAAVGEKWNLRADGEISEEGFRKGADCGLELTSLMCLRARYFWGRLMSAYPGTSFS